MKYLILVTILFTGSCNSKKEPINNEENVSEDESIKSRNLYITKLVTQVIDETKVLENEGFDNGSGLLYQATNSYQKLLTKCSDAELKDIHIQIIPAAPYVPYEK